MWTVPDGIIHQLSFIPLLPYSRCYESYLVLQGLALGITKDRLWTKKDWTFGPGPGFLSMKDRIKTSPNKPVLISLNHYIVVIINPYKKIPCMALEVRGGNCGQKYNKSIKHFR